MCYVNEPTSCHDAEWGFGSFKKYSYQACGNNTYKYLNAIYYIDINNNTYPIIEQYETRRLTFNVL